MNNLIHKKGKISGVAQNGSISTHWSFRVANFGFNFLRHFSINFGNSCARLVANFMTFYKTLPTFQIGLVLMGVFDKKPKKMKIRKFGKLSQPWNLTFFCGWDFSTFFLLIWLKSTKIKLRPYFIMEKVQKLTENT